MNKLAALLLLSSLTLSPLLQASSNGNRVHYVGGTVAELPSKTEGTIEIRDDEEFRFQAPAVLIRVPYREINLLEYGQKVDRRFLEALLISPLLLLSKKRTHFLTIGYSDLNGKQQAMVFQINHSDIRAVLAGLEARTGRQVEYQDDDARKSGKG